METNEKENAPSSPDNSLVIAEDLEDSAALQSLRLQKEKLQDELNSRTSSKNVSEDLTASILKINELRTGVGSESLCATPTIPNESEDNSRSPVSGAGDAVMAEITPLKSPPAPSKEKSKKSLSSILNGKCKLPSANISLKDYVAKLPEYDKNKDTVQGRKPSSLGKPIVDLTDDNKCDGPLTTCDTIMATKALQSIKSKVPVCISFPDNTNNINYYANNKPMSVFPLKTNAINSTKRPTSLPVKRVYPSTNTITVSSTGISMNVPSTITVATSTLSNDSTMPPALRLVNNSTNPLYKLVSKQPTHVKSGTLSEPINLIEGEETVTSSTSISPIFWTPDRSEVQPSIAIKNIVAHTTNMITVPNTVLNNVSVAIHTTANSGSVPRPLYTLKGITAANLNQIAAAKVPLKLVVHKSGGIPKTILAYQTPVGNVKPMVRNKLEIKSSPNLNKVEVQATAKPNVLSTSKNDIVWTPELVKSLNTFLQAKQKSPAQHTLVQTPLQTPVQTPLQTPVQTPVVTSPQLVYGQLSMLQSTSSSINQPVLLIQNPAAGGRSLPVQPQNINTTGQMLVQKVTLPTSLANHSNQFLQIIPVTVPSKVNSQAMPLQGMMIVNVNTTSASSSTDTMVTSVCSKPLVLTTSEPPLLKPPSLATCSSSTSSSMCTPGISPKISEVQSVSISNTSSISNTVTPLMVKQIGFTGSIGKMKNVAQVQPFTIDYKKGYENIISGLSAPVSMPPSFTPTTVGVVDTTGTSNIHSNTEGNANIVKNPNQLTEDLYQKSTESSKKMLMPLRDSESARCNGLKPYKRVDTVLFDTATGLISPFEGSSQYPVISEYKSLAVSSYSDTNPSITSMKSYIWRSVQSPISKTLTGKLDTLSSNIDSKVKVKSEVVDLTGDQSTEMQETESATAKDTVGVIRSDQEIPEPKPKKDTVGVIRTDETIVAQSGKNVPDSYQNVKDTLLKGIHIKDKGSTMLKIFINKEGVITREEPRVTLPLPKKQNPVVPSTVKSPVKSPVKSIVDDITKRTKPNSLNASGDRDEDMIIREKAFNYMKSLNHVDGTSLQEELNATQKRDHVSTSDHHYSAIRKKSPNFQKVSSLQEELNATQKRDHVSTSDHPYSAIRKKSSNFQKVSRTLFALDRLYLNRKRWQGINATEVVIDTLRELRDELIVERSKQKSFMEKKLNRWKQNVKGSNLEERTKEKDELVKTPAQRLLERFSLNHNNNNVEHVEIESKKEELPNNNNIKTGIKTQKDRPKTFMEIMEEQRRKKAAKQKESCAVTPTTPTSTLDTSLSPSEITPKTSSPVFATKIIPEKQKSFADVLEEQKKRRELKKLGKNSKLMSANQNKEKEMVTVVSPSQKDEGRHDSNVSGFTFRSSRKSSALKNLVSSSESPKTTHTSISTAKPSPTSYKLTTTVSKPSTGSTSSKSSSNLKIIDLDSSPTTRGSKSRINTGKTNANSKSLNTTKITSSTSDTITTSVTKSPTIIPYTRSPTSIKSKSSTTLADNKISSTLTRSKYISSLALLSTATVPKLSTTITTTKPSSISTAKSASSSSTITSPPVVENRNPYRVRHLRKYSNPKDPVNTVEDRALQRALALSLKLVNKGKTKKCDVNEEGKSDTETDGKAVKNWADIDSPVTSPPCSKKKRTTEIDKLVDCHWNESWIKKDVAKTSRSRQSIREERALHYAMVRFAEMEVEEEKSLSKTTSPVEEKKSLSDKNGLRKVLERLKQIEMKEVRLSTSKSKNEFHRVKSQLLKQKTLSKNQVGKIKSGKVEKKRLTSSKQKKNELVKKAMRHFAGRNRCSATTTDVATVVINRLPLDTLESNQELSVIEKKKEYILVPKYSGFKDFTPIVVSSRTRAQATTEDRSKFRKTQFPLMLIGKVGNETKNIVIQKYENMEKVTEVADVKAPFLESLPACKNKIVSVCKHTGETVLHKAARLGYADVAEANILSGADVHARDNAGWSALHEACAFSKVEVAKVLLKYGADPNCLSNTGSRPLHDAAEKMNIRMIRLLLSYGADPSIASYKGFLPIDCTLNPRVRKLLEGYNADTQACLGKPSSKEDYWTFKGSCDILDGDEYSDIFMDIPSEKPPSSFEIEMSSKPMLNSYYLPRTDEDNVVVGYRNYFILSDLLNRVNMSRTAFLKKHNVDILTMSHADLLQCLGNNGAREIPNICSSSSKSSSKVELVFMGVQPLRKLLNLKTIKIDY